MSKQKGALGRRRVLLSLGASIGAAAAVTAVPTRRAEAAAEPPLGQRDRVALLLQPALGAAALSGWTIASAGGVRLGAVPITMTTPEGQRFHVELLRRDPSGDPAGPQAIAETAHFALYMSNRGDGATATDETQGRGLLALRRFLVSREAELAAAGLALPQVMTLRERDLAYPDGHFSPRA